MIADGPATERGELALGQNVLVAFMPWGGYNFEDSILISERSSRTTSSPRSTSRSSSASPATPSSARRRSPATSRTSAKRRCEDLDEAGIVRIGAEVKSGDILVGKITPKGETQLSPEEKLLRAIFGEKAGDVRDTSLRVPPGVAGTVIGAQVFSRRGVEKDERARAIEEAEVERLRKDQEDEIKIIRDSAIGQGPRAARREAGRQPGRRRARKETFDARPGDTVTAEVLAPGADAALARRAGDGRAGAGSGRPDLRERRRAGWRDQDRLRREDRAAEEG